MNGIGSRAPAQIKLSEILRALEGPLSLVDCVADVRACNRSKRCPARRVWQNLSGAIEDMLDNVTLEDMIASKTGTCSGLNGEGKEQKSPQSGRNARSSGATSRRRQTKANQK